MKKVVPLRIPVYLKADLISDDKSYAGIIGNLSEEGAYVEIDNVKTAMPFLPRKKLELKFQVAPQKTLNLLCEVVWLYSKRIPPHSLTNDVGLEIIDPPPKYKYFLKSL